jgi:uncharacterized protein YqjF (DUF2071 family)
MQQPFLTAEWRDLAMLSWEVDPELLRPHVPEGTELDSREGRTYLSVVAFRFLDTRLRGIAVPFHRDFEEVNLRLYVRRRGSEGWRRGVVFVRELVPRAAIAAVARLAYGERYLAVPMSHSVERAEPDGWTRSVRFGWRSKGREEELRLAAQGPPGEPEEGGLEEFIAEHYWGYARRRDGSTTEYRVEHPRWRVSPGVEPLLDCDAEVLYGATLARTLEGPPDSAFLAEGSRVAVYSGARAEAEP